MSTRFTKILTYCVLAMAIVAIVVCAAICLTNAVGVKISVDALYLSKTYATENGQEVVIKINGEQTNELVVKKDSTVTLSFEAPGYKFNGWYGVSGSEVTGDTETIGTSVSYEFKASNDMNFAAQFEAIQYQVSYTGVDGVSTETLTYGAPLYTPSQRVTESSGDYVIFLGWQDPTDSTKTISTVGAFETTTITLNAQNANLSDYQFTFNVAATTYGTAGEIPYDSLTGANLSAPSMPQRPFYSLSSIEFNGQQFALTDTESINSELVKQIVSMSNGEAIEINVTPVWTLNFDSIVINFETPYEDDGFEIDNSQPIDIESLLLTSYAPEDIDVYGFRITYGDTTMSNNVSESVATYTIANMLGEERFNIGQDQGGTITFTIDWVY